MNTTWSPKIRRTVSAAVLTLAVLTSSACAGGTEAGGAAVATTVEPQVAGTQDAAPGESMPAFGLVTPADAARLATAEGVTVIDVRTPEEYAQGHIDGSTMIDFYAATFTDDIAALDPDGTYLVYCRSGNRSGQATALMQQLGFDRVYDLAGGVVAYARQGLPLVR